MASSESKHRRLWLEKTYGSLYELETFGDRHSCAYCGDLRELLDHCPPLHLVDKLTIKQVRKLDIPMILVPCCSQCNRMLGGRHLPRYEDRLAFLYRKVSDKVERCSIWSSSELENLTGELQRMVTARQVHIRREYLNRLRGIEERLIRLHSGPVG